MQRLKKLDIVICALSDQVQAAITDETVGFLYVKSHHCVQKNMPSIDQIQEVCHRNGIPLLIDAAAEEDIQSYASLGDLVIFSGSKAIEGPTSGILAGKKQYIDYTFPHLKGIGRAMKVRKGIHFRITCGFGKL